MIKVLAFVPLAVVGDPIVCTEEIVQAAASAGFIDSIYTCLKLENTPGPQQCLTEFIAANGQDVVTIGGCRDAYQALVIAWADVIGDCPSDAPDLDCFTEYFADGLTAFASATGGYMPTSSMCTAAEVRAYAEGDAFGTIASSEWANGSAWSGNDSICDYCYTEVFYPLLDELDLGDNPGLSAECLEASEVCLNSGFMLTARGAFDKCAGLDILFTGPVCVSGTVDIVENLIPKPYYTFAQCAYHPYTSFCHTIPEYLATIEEDTDSVDCLACYTELQADLLALAASDTDDVCGTDVFAGECIAYQVQALTDFEVCSGTTINVDPTSAPTLAATEAPTTKAVTQATTAEGSTTTVADTTAKSSEMGTVVATMAFIALSIL